MPETLNDRIIRELEQYILFLEGNRLFKAARNVEILIKDIENE